MEVALTSSTFLWRLPQFCASRTMDVNHKLGHV